MSRATKLMIFLIFFALIDTVIPIPIMTLILIYVLLERPPWFKNYVDEIYQDKK